MSLSAQQAAEALGVSRMQVSRLVRQGDLRAHRLGHALVIDADSVRAYRELRPGRGRPLSPRAAWERIAAESGRLAAHSSNPQALDAARQLAIVTRRRADRQPFRALPNRIVALLADERVVLSGAVAGESHGAPVRAGPPHPVYLSSDDLDHLVADHRLRHDEMEPNIIVRVVDPLSWILDHRVAPPLVAAIDAIDEGDARSAAEIVAHALDASERAR
jgi:excisionase family DNA binding protein